MYSLYIYNINTNFFGLLAQYLTIVIRLKSDDLDSLFVFCGSVECIPSNVIVGSLNDPAR